MLIKETVERDVYVAPCLKCGSTEIRIDDDNYSSFNQGGGECMTCGHKTYAGVGCLPKIEEMIAIWNAGNDIDTLIKVETRKIEEATAAIKELGMKAAQRHIQLPKEAGMYHIKPRNGGEAYMSQVAPDSWELRECDIEWIPA